MWFHVVKHVKLYKADQFQKLTWSIQIDRKIVPYVAMSYDLEIQTYTAF